MARDPAAYEANNYHSGVLHSAENHRWVTAMDVAIGQAVTLDDPDWRELLVLIADWKLTRDAVRKIRRNANYGRLPPETLSLIEYCAKYYQHGEFPDGQISDVQPPLVTSELTPKAQAAHERALLEQAAREQRFYEDQVSRNWGRWGGL